MTSEKNLGTEINNHIGILSVLCFIHFSNDRSTIRRSFHEAKSKLERNFSLRSLDAISVDKYGSNRSLDSIGSNHSNKAMDSYKVSQRLQSVCYKIWVTFDEKFSKNTRSSWKISKFSRYISNCEILSLAKQLLDRNFDQSPIQFYHNSI